KLQLAERGTWIGDRKSGLWVRETRKLTTSGHQVSLISSAFGESAREDSVRLFSRWSQENFFRYMMQHFAIDLLNEYATEEIPETKRPVVNPKRRELDRRKRSVKSKLTLRQEARERRIISNVKPFIETLRVTNPVRQSRASSRKRVLRGGWETAPAKRRQPDQTLCD